MNESCHTYERVMPHIRKSHVTHLHVVGCEIRVAESFFLFFPPPSHMLHPRWCVCVRERDKVDNTALPLRPKCVYVGVCVGVCGGGIWDKAHAVPANWKAKFSLIFFLELPRIFYVLWLHMGLADTLIGTHSLLADSITGSQ